MMASAAPLIPATLLLLVVGVAAVEELEEDVATWEEIKVTSIFTVATSLAFLIIYEFCRRNPSVAAVFDRRRATKPSRTPPPLMRGRIFEWMFLSTDPAYIEYSDMVHKRDVIRERKRQQARASGDYGVGGIIPFRLPYNMSGGGALPGGGGGGSGSPTSVETIVEEEMPQHHKKKKKHGHPPAPAISSSTTAKTTNGTSGGGGKPPLPTGGNGTSARSNFSANLGGGESGRISKSGSGGSNRRVFFKDQHDEVDLEAGRRRGLSSDDEGFEGGSSGSSSEDDQMLLSPMSDESPVAVRKKDRAGGGGSSSRQHGTSRRSAQRGRVSAVQHSADESGVELVAALSLTKSTSSTRSGGGGGGGNAAKMSRAARMLTPDVVVVNGRRLPASVAEYAIAGDLTEEQLDGYEDRLLEMERQEERRFRDRQMELAGRVGGGVKRGSRKRAAAQDADGGYGSGEEEVGLDDIVIHAPSRFAYFGFQAAGDGSQRSFFGRIFNRSSGNLMSKQDGEDDDFQDEPINGGTGTGSSRTVSTLTKSTKSKSSSGGGTGSSLRSVAPSSSRYRASGDMFGSKHANRHLKSAAVTRKRPLSISDQELLRCTGLDTFVMIRFLRFGFDVTFYPFLAACIFLMPTYYTNPWDGTPQDETQEPKQTSGYFSITMNRLEPGSPRLWVCWAFAFIYFFWVLRRQWVEWETFTALRFDFLANGDVEVEDDTTIEGMKKRLGPGGDSLVAQKDDVQLHLEQYRNSCLVEFIPESHRRDQELREFFEAVFPGQVKRAEVLLNCTTLTKLINERQSYVVMYENLYARQFHAKQAYRRRTENQLMEDVGVCSYICCRCCGRDPKKPEEPKVRAAPENGSASKWRCFKCCCCGKKKMVKALPFYLSEIKRLNREVEKEHRRILEEKQKVEDKDSTGRLFASTIAQGLKLATGVTSTDLTCQTGFVEFRTLTAKQSAIQCNITGTTDYMLTSSAPDPRDIAWENATVELSSIRLKKMQVEALLFTGTLFWSVVVTAITSISNLDRLDDFLPGWMIPEEGTFWYGLIQGYLPVIFLELLMLLVPIVLRFVGLKYIRFKTKSNTDTFIFRWHFAYRVANLIIIIIKNQIYETLNAFRTNPEAAISTLAAGLSVSSQFFLNNMIVAAGTETMWELAQMPQMIRHFVMHKYITVEAKSKRYLEKLEMPEAFEWGDDVPQFIFAFLVGAVYCVNVPLVIGVVSVYFYVATKVYTHQSLFVYAQPYEGGGKLMYLLNRTVFVIIYIAVTIFSINLGLSGAKYQAPSFFVIMIILAFLMDRRISKTFVKPSVTLALTNSRIIDEDIARKQDRLRRYKEYKAAKAEKKAQAAKDRKAAVLKKNSIVLEQASSRDASSVSKSPGDTCGGQQKSIQFQVLREDTQEQLRQRKAAKISAAAKGNSVMAFAGNDSDEENAGTFDFYLYRQPQLNKSLWETKPRPYR